MCGPAAYCSPIHPGKGENGMMHSRATTPMACVLGLLLFGYGPGAAQDLKPDPEGFLVARPADLVPEDGGRRITLLGDPNEPGLYVIRITFLPGQGSRPHFHDQARYITVIAGTWWVSTGAHADVYDPDSMQRVEPGSFIYEPPNGHHYDMAKDEAVTVQIMGTGPVRTTSLADDTN
jgi:quercetin dioxygenase-like cupin family protein